MHAFIVFFITSAGDYKPSTKHHISVFIVFVAFQNAKWPGCLFCFQIVMTK
jgi:hypothetical protein